MFLNQIFVNYVSLRFWGEGKGAYIFIQILLLLK